MSKRFFLTVVIFLLALSTSSFVYAGFGRLLCKQDGFSCHRVREGQTWERLYPDERERSIQMRINRMNTQLYAGMVIAVPDNLDEATIMDFAPFPLQLNTNNEKLIIVDPYQKAWGAYDKQGELLRWGPLSAGSDKCTSESGEEGDEQENCRTTPGSFRIFSLGTSGCISHKYPEPEGGAPMPYCMFFNNGQALHGSPNGVVGYNASHGCVRLYVNDAEWLRFDFAEGPNASNRYRGTRVIVREYEPPQNFADANNSTED